MPEYTEEDKKKLAQMAFDFRHSSLTTDEEILHESEGYEAEVLMQQGHKDHQKMEKMFRDRFLVDTKTADELRESFPDLYELAQAKRRKLEARANVSGFNKIKTDFWGSKKKKAQRKLEEIETDKQKLEDFRAGFEVNSRLFTNRTRELQRKIDRRRAELESQLATANEEQKERILYALGKLKGADKSLTVDGAYEMEHKLFLASDYNVNLHFAMDSITERNVAINRKSGKRESLGKDRLYRDIGRFVCPMFKANETESRMDEIWKIGDCIRCFQTGTHLALEEPKEEEIGHEVAKEATPQEQAQNFQTLISHMEVTKQEYIKFMEMHPELYIVKPTNQALLDNLEELKEVFCKGQVTDYVLEEIRKSKYFKMTKNDTPFALSDEDRKKYWDLTVFLTAFKTNIQAMSTHANTLGHYYLRHPGVSDESVRETVLTFDEAIEVKKTFIRREFGNVV